MLTSCAWRNTSFPANDGAGALRACPAGHGAMRIVACTAHASVIDRILAYLRTHADAECSLETGSVCTGRDATTRSGLPDSLGLTPTPRPRAATVGVRVSPPRASDQFPLDRAPTGTADWWRVIEVRIAPNRMGARLGRRKPQQCQPYCEDFQRRQPGAAPGSDIKNGAWANIHCPSESPEIFPISPPVAVGSSSSDSHQHPVQSNFNNIHNTSTGQCLQHTGTRCWSSSQIETTPQNSRREQRLWPKRIDVAIWFNRQCGRLSTGHRKTDDQHSRQPKSGNGAQSPPHAPKAEVGTNCSTNHCTKNCPTCDWRADP